MFLVLWSRYQAYDLEIMQLKKLMEDNKQRYDILKTLCNWTFKYAEKKFVIDITFRIKKMFYVNNAEEQVQSIDGVFCLHSCHSLHIMCNRE